MTEGFNNQNQINQSEIAQNNSTSMDLNLFGQPLLSNAQQQQIQLQNQNTMDQRRRMPTTESSAAALLDNDLYKDYIGQIQAQKQDHLLNDEINNREVIQRPSQNDLFSKDALISMNSFGSFNS